MKTQHSDNDHLHRAAPRKDDPFRPVSSLLADEAARNNSPWRRRLFRSGFFFGAVLFHLILFILVASWVVFRPPDTTESEPFQLVKIPPLSPPPAPPPPAGGDTRNLLEPETTLTPPSAPPQIIVSPINPNFAIESKPVPLPNMPNLPAAPAVPQGSGLEGDSVPGANVGSGSPFGTPGGAGAAQFIGYLYDLKQTSGRKPSGMTTGHYHSWVIDFIKSEWEPRLLAPYYKSPKPLATPCIYIPTLKATEGPRAFGVEKEVQPDMYVVWYHVRAAPPKEGTYHFAGIGDDVLVVRVDGHTVLDGSLSNIWSSRSGQKSYPIQNFKPSSQNESRLQVGEPFHATPVNPVDIDVLIGEEPGGNSNYFLLIQRDESIYEPQSNGAPLLPIFQVTPNPVVPAGAPQTYPPFSTEVEAWTASGNK